MEIPLPALIIQGLPEQIAVMTLAFVFAKIRLEWKKIIIFAIIMTLTVYLLRMLPITFGIHTIVLLGLQFFFLIQFCQVHVLEALRACLISVLLLIMVEYICFTLFTVLFGISFETYMNDVTTRILISWPQVIVLFLISFIVLKVRTGREKYEHL